MKLLKCLLQGHLNDGVVSGRVDGAWTGGSWVIENCYGGMRDGQEQG